MDRNDYLKYIAHFVEKVDMNPTMAMYKAFFLKHLGKDMFTATDDKIKKTAIHLYKAYVLGEIIKIGSFDLAASLTTEQLTAVINEEKKLIDKYNLDFPLAIDIVPSKMDAAIKRLSASAKKTILDSFTDEPVKKAPVKRAPKKTVKKTPAKPAGKKAPARKPVAKKTPARKPAVKKTSPKKIIITKKVTKPSAKGKVDCKKKYTLPELKGLAKTMKIVGYSKMGKDKLCEELGF